jgi:hypothetical protein
MLMLWVLGTFVFAAFMNWTVNARSILPMTPAIGILIVRRLEYFGMIQTRIRKITLCAISSAALALLVTQADFFTGSAVR